MSKIYRISEFAKRIGRSPSTVRRWEAEGKIRAKRLTSGHRYFLMSSGVKTRGAYPLDGSQTPASYAA